MPAGLAPNARRLRMADQDCGRPAPKAAAELSYPLIKLEDSGRLVRWLAGDVLE